MINREKDEYILIVDDNVENVRILGLILSGEGWRRMLIRPSELLKRFLLI